MFKKKSLFHSLRGFVAFLWTVKNNVVFHLVVWIKLLWLDNYIGNIHEYELYNKNVRYLLCILITALVLHLLIHFTKTFRSSVQSKHLQNVSGWKIFLPSFSTQHFFFFFCSSTPPKYQVMNLKRNAKATPIFEVSKKKIKLIASFTAS